jgi:hypothetical protein
MEKKEILKKIESLFFEKSFGEVTLQEIGEKL